MDADRFSPEDHSGQVIGASRDDRYCIYGAAQTKFAASSMLPVPLYFATCGYGQSGRVRSTLPAVACDAMIWSGALPCSTHRSSGPTLSNTFGPSPPPQWPMPGAMNSRMLSDALGSQPPVSPTLW